MKRKKSSHLSYLLRLWSVPIENSQLWRASIENVATGERRGFADLEALLGYLFQIIEDSDTIDIHTTENKGLPEPNVRCE